MPTTQEVINMPLTDDGNALRLFARYKDFLRWTHGLGWMFWNGTHWERSDHGALQFARECARDITVDAQWMMQQAEIMKDSNPEKAGSMEDHATHMAKWAKKSQDNNRILSILKLAVSEEQLHAPLESWNPNPLHLNCLNGVLDLETGELLPHDPRYLCTNITRCKFNPDAQCPTWHKFISEITGNDDAVANTLHMIAGYCVTGYTTERKFFIFTGHGKNGKSAFADTIVYLLGNYADALPSSTLAVRNFMGIPNDVASLHDKRLVVASETDASHRLNEPFVKSITGDAFTRARFLRQEFFTFRPKFKLILGTNEEPTISDNSQATWDRLRCVPFTQRFDGDKEVSGMFDKLITEKEGILNWLLEGTTIWINSDRKIAFSDDTMRETATYRESQDTVQQFVDENTYSAIGTRITKRALIEAYNSWAVALGHQRISARRLGMLLKRKNWEDHRSKVAGVTTHVWVDRALTNDPITNLFDSSSCRNKEGFSMYT